MKFVTVGVNMQQDSESKQEALRKFKNSCNICSYRGVKLDCDACPIREAHQLTVAIFDDLASQSK